MHTLGESLKIVKALILCLLLLVIPVLVRADILTVGQGGAYQYTTIQSAINSSTHADVIEVNPGEYFEFLDTQGKNITIRSLFYATQSEETIRNTVIYTVLPHPCLTIDEHESVILDGFTLLNNPTEELDHPYVGISNLQGGGIVISNNASVQISNCVIRNCYGQLAGGVYFAGNNFYMSNTTIRGCYSMDGPGGLFVSGQEQGSISFDSVHPNSIYDNTGPLGMDLCVGYLTQPLELVLETFSVVLTEPDWFWLWYDLTSSINVTVQNGYIEEVDSDLYVSSEGDDSNSGLSPQDPLKTIARAVKIIAPDSLQSNTIHVAVGEYNFSGSGQYFPLNLKSYTRLVGDDPHFVIFNMEETHRPCIRVTKQRCVTIEGITFIPHVHWRGDRHPIQAIYCERVELRDLHWSGNQESIYSDFVRIQVYDCNGVICENITARNATTNNTYNVAVEVQFSRYVQLNNIEIENLIALDDAFNSGLVIYESDASVRNVVMTNCYANTGLMFWYQAWVTENVNLDLSNMLFISNLSTSADMGAPIYIFNNFERVQIRNCTFAYNDANGRRIMNLRGYGDIYNCIFYNPDNYYQDLILSNVYYGVTYDPTVSYSLFTVPVVANDASHATLSNIIVGIDPLFAGHGQTSWDPLQPSSYHLSAESPCVNSGTPDVSGLNLPVTDLAGNYRVWDNRVDMGCYEYGSDPYVSVHDPDIPSPSESISLSFYPNPVFVNEHRSGHVYIEFCLPGRATEEPKIGIYNLKGQKVKTLKASKGTVGTGKPGNDQGEFYSTVYDCHDQFNHELASGIYLVKVESGPYHKTGKITIIK